MDSNEVFDLVARERRGLADLLDSLSDEQLSTRSICTEWTVRDVFAHLLVPLVISLPAVMVKLAFSGLNFDTVNVKLSAKVGTRSTAELASGLRNNAAHRFTPPTMGPEAPLTEQIVHGQDIRRPLGFEREIPEEILRVSLDFLSHPKTKGFVPKGLLGGLRFETADPDWTWGQGPLVAGKADAVVMAMAGRATFLDELDGDGVAVMRSRLR